MATRSGLLLITRSDPAANAAPRRRTTEQPFHDHWLFHRCHPDHTESSPDALAGGQVADVAGLDMAIYQVKCPRSTGSETNPPVGFEWHVVDKSPRRSGARNRSGNLQFEIAKGQCRLSDN
jgi:hypothetical protein